MKRQGLRLHVLCALLGAFGVLAFESIAKAVVIAQHPVPAPAAHIIGWSGGLVATGIIANPPNVLASSITPSPFKIGKEYSASDTSMAIGLGLDGDPWIAGSATGGGGFALYDITPTAAIQQAVFSSAVSALAAGDGSVWMAAAKTILRYQPGVGLKSYELPTSIYAVDIVAGPDGAMWFTDIMLGTIGRISDSGEVTIYPVEDGDRQFGWGYMGPYGIAVGPDGALWFTEQNHERIGRMTTNGELQEFVVPRSQSTSSMYPQPRFIVSGPDNSMWFSDPGDSSIGRITMAGEITEYPVLAGGAEATPNELTVGPEGVLWFTEAVKDIGSLDPNATAAATVSHPARRARSSRRCRGHLCVARRHRR